MNGGPMPQDLDAFLAGALEPEETVRVLRSLSTDDAARRQIEDSSGFEAVLLDNMYAATQSVPDRDVVAEAVAEAAGELSIRIVCGDGPDEARFRLMVEEAVARAPVVASRVAPAERRTSRWWWTAAALIALAVGLVWMATTHDGTRTDRSVVENSGRTIDRPRSDVGSGTDTGIAALMPEKPVVEIRTAREPARIVQTPDTRLGVVQLDSASGIFVEERTRLKAETVGRDRVTVELAHGTALFSVEPGRYRSFEVCTPYATVVATGTIFRVAVEDDQTSVEVLEGAVRVDAAGTSTYLTPSGTVSAADISSDSVVVRAVRETVEHGRRSRLLQSYLHYLSDVHENVIDDTAFGGVLDSVESALLDRAGDGPLLDAQDVLLYRTAADVAANGNVRRALPLLRRLVQGSSNDTLAQLAACRAALLYRHRRSSPEAAVAIADTGLSRHGAETVARALSTTRIAGLVDLNRPEDAVRAVEEHLARFGRGSESADLVFQAAQLCRTRLEQWERAADHYAWLVDSVPAGRYHEDAIYWAGWCLVQRGADRFARRFRTLYDSAYPEGNWRGE